MDWKIYFLVIPLINGARALTCLQCKGVSQPRHCTIVDECYPGEVCGVEQVRNTLGHTVYNVGCIIQSKCQNNSITHQGIRNEGCLECCHSDLCNAQGCGEPGYPQTRGPICYNCPLHTSLGTCNAITFCEPGDVCKFAVFKEFGDKYILVNVPPHITTVYRWERVFHGGYRGQDLPRVEHPKTPASSPYIASVAAVVDLRYTVYQVSITDMLLMKECKHDNNQGSVIVGRDVTNVQEKSGAILVQRSLIEHVCTGCCDNDLCNKGCNGTTLISDHCSSSPCLHGRCVNTDNGFACVCDYMYTGVTCDSLIDVCESSPCQSGSCVSKGSNYTCVCSQGFGGLHCEKVMTDCLDIFNHGGKTVDGIYTIRTWKTHQKIRVYCDMTTTAGGWTVIQHRFDKSVSFYRNFSEYENGFGDLTSEFWLGLKYIQEIASQSTTHLRVDVEADNGTAAFETFNMFKLSPRPAYTLYLGDTISSDKIHEINRFGKRANGTGFSTFDHDVDTSSENCASRYHGGWWYDNCYGVDLNGREMYYHGFIDNAILKSSKMMIRKN